MKYKVLLFMFLFIACKKLQPQYNNISKIELARSGAWSDFGAAISIDSSLNYKYYGNYGKVKQGYFLGKASRKLWDTLTQKLEKINFKTVSSSDNLSVADVNYYEVIIHWKNHTKKIIRVSPRESDAVINTIRWLDSSFRKVNLHQVNNPIKFETTYHELPKPEIDSVSYPPPAVQPKKSGSK
jgi:hypothetical protein